MGKTTVSFDLSEKGINKAIRELEAYRNELIRKCNELIRQLTEHGEEVAKMEVVQLGAFDTGNLQESIHGYFDPDVGVGFVRAECWYAVYVEFGTGIVGARTPHPNAMAHGWVYDHNHHGERGWVYWSGRDGHYHWTQGHPQTPFMYNTMRILQTEAQRIAHDVFNQ